MRKLIWILAFLMMIACAAQAEEYYCTQTDDLYYHVNANCGDLTDMYSLSAEDAKNSGKFPCPVCVPDDTEWTADIAAVARGNTIIVRISDDYLQASNVEEAFGHESIASGSISELPARISEYLHGDAYNRFLQESTSGSTSTIARVPEDIIRHSNYDGYLIMNARHIGSAWFMALRPENEIGDTWDMEWVIAGYKIDVQQDTFTIDITARGTRDPYPVSVTEFSDPAAFRMQYDDFRIDIYTDAGADVRANVAVITQFNADADYLNSTALCIGDQVRIPISGYMDGTDGIFCCTLTDAEYAYLENGAAIAVQPVNQLTQAAFGGSPYSVMRKGGSGYGIADASGAFVVPPEYQYIERPSAAEYPTTIPAPFWCMGYDDSLTIIDCYSLDVITHIDLTREFMRTHYINPALYELRDANGLHIMSLTTDEPQFHIAYASDTDTSRYANGVTGVDGRYRCMADGYPTRLVLNDQNGARLITNDGDIVSESYPRITPLIWKIHQGAFLVESWDPSLGLLPDGHDFQRGEVMSVPSNKPSWRCGLMDKSGEIIVPIEYTSVEVTDDLTVIFRGAGDPVSIAYQ